MSGKTIEELAEDLRSADTRVRVHATEELKRALTRREDLSAAIPALVTALEDEEAIVRENSTRILDGALKHEKSRSTAFSALLEALVNSRGVVQHRSAWVLAKASPRNYDDLKVIADAARKAKEGGQPASYFAHLYSSWAKALNERAGNLVSDKAFPTSKVEKPDKIERVRKIMRA